MGNESRITGGGIENLVELGRVERVGFCSVNELRRARVYAKFYLLIDNGMSCTEPEERKLKSEGITPSISDLSEFLSKSGFYLAHSNLSTSFLDQLNSRGIPAHSYSKVPVYVFGTADLYKTREDPKKKSKEVIEVPDLMPVNLE